MAEITTSQIGNGTTAYGSDIVVKDLDLDDFAEIIQDRTAQTFAEATVRLRGATIAYGDYDPGSMARCEGS